MGPRAGGGFTHGTFLPRDLAVVQDRDPGGRGPPADVARFVRAHPGIDVVLRGAGGLPGRRIAQWAGWARRAGAARAIAEVVENEAWARSAREWVDESDVDVVAIVAADAVRLA